MNNTDIFKHLKQQYNYIKSLGYDILYLGLQGSQNYNLDSLYSDVDSICIVVPTMNNILNNDKPASQTYKLSNGEQIDVKDIRLVFKYWIAQNTQYLQILFTDYKIVNKDYRDYVNSIFEHNEQIAHINPIALFKNVLNISKSNYIKVFSKDDDYNGKDLYHLLRLYNLIRYYNDNLHYKEALTTYYDDFRALILECKEHKLDNTKAKQIAQDYMGRLMNQAYDLDMNSVENKTTINYLNNMLKLITTKRLKKDLNIIPLDINIEQYPNVFVTSDNHFGHKNIIYYEHRDTQLDISNIVEHDNKLIENWNKVVHKKDLVIILGDFSFHKASKTMDILNQLNGYKILIEGNHDCNYLKDKSFDKSLFLAIYEYKEFHYKGNHICFMHYPIQSFKNMDSKGRPYVHIHGHIHSAPYTVPMHSYNAGVDINDYYPIPLEAAIKKALSNKGNMKNGDI